MALRREGKEEVERKRGERGGKALLKPRTGTASKRRETPEMLTRERGRERKNGMGRKGK